MNNDAGFWGRVASRQCRRAEKAEAEVARLKEALQELYDGWLTCHGTEGMSEWLGEHPMTRAERVLKESK